MYYDNILTTYIIYIHIDIHFFLRTLNNQPPNRPVSVTPKNWAEIFRKKGLTPGPSTRYFGRQDAEPVTERRKRGG